MDAVTLVKPDDGLLLWTFMIGWAAVSVWLEQKYRWAATLSGCMIALLGAMLAANFGIVPLDAPAYDAVWAYVVPIAVPLLLFDADIRRIKRESGGAFIAFHIAALGTMLGTIIATVLLHRYIPEIKGVLAMFTGTYIGGSVNLAAMRDAFGVSPEMTSASIVADNFLMAIYFFVLMLIPNLVFFRKRYRVSHENVTGEAVGPTNAARFWERSEISLLDIAICAAATMIIVTVSTKFSDFVNASGIPDLLKLFFGQKYLVITTVTVALATVFPSFFRGLHGARELGTFLIHIFFVVIGVPASLSMILERSPLLFVFASVIVLSNLVVSLILGKLFKIDLHELIICCNATVGGPTTAAAMCITKGWNALIVPALLVGVWGYVLGNYCGVLMANLLSYLFILT
ncbi:MAG: DUF819 family protein [Synergistaceae bacterium]|nr:DUF819 family protein [Synergistaceae bacterium]